MHKKTCSFRDKIIAHEHWGHDLTTEFSIYRNGLQSLRERDTSDPQDEESRVTYQARADLFQDPSPPKKTSVKEISSHLLLNVQFFIRSKP